MLQEIQKYNILKIMNENLETIAYSIVFLSNIVEISESKVDIDITFTEKDEIFGSINDSLLSTVLELYEKTPIDVSDIGKSNDIMVKKFKSSNGLEFVYERPYKLTIKYAKNKGTIATNPNDYLSGFANLLLLKLKAKSKVQKIGMNYEIFFPLESPENKIKNKLIRQGIPDDSLENGFIKLSYKIDIYTKMYLGITTAKHEGKEGLYFNVNFDCIKKGDNDISSILSTPNFLGIAGDKIDKLLNLTDENKQ